MNAIITDQIKLAAITADSASQMAKLTYRKARYDFNTRLKPVIKDTIIITWVILAILYTIWNDLIIWSIDRYVESCLEKQNDTAINGDNDSKPVVTDSDTDDNQSNDVIENRGKVAAQALKALEASTTVKVITPDMLLSKKGKPLTGSAKAAKINKLIKEGYEII